jgi:hypothetical protein
MGPVRCTPADMRCVQPDRWCGRMHSPSGTLCSRCSRWFTGGRWCAFHPMIWGRLTRKIGDTSAEAKHVRRTARASTCDTDDHVRLWQRKHQLLTETTGAFISSVSSGSTYSRLHAGDAVQHAVECCQKACLEHCHKLLYDPRALKVLQYEGDYRLIGEEPGLQMAACAMDLRGADERKGEVGTSAGKVERLDTPFSLPAEPLDQLTNKNCRNAQLETRRISRETAHQVLHRRGWFNQSFRTQVADYRSNLCFRLGTTNRSALYSAIHITFIPRRLPRKLLLDTFRRISHPS